MKHRRDSIIMGRLMIQRASHGVLSISEAFA